ALKTQPNWRSLIFSSSRRNAPAIEIFVRSRKAVALSRKSHAISKFRTVHRLRRTIPALTMNRDLNDCHLQHGYRCLGKCDKDLAVFDGRVQLSRLHSIWLIESIVGVHLRRLQNAR